MTNRSWFDENGGKRVWNLGNDHARMLHIHYNEDINALPQGQGVARNHIGCPAGHDTKSRLWIYRGPGGVSFSCLHCNTKLFLPIKKRPPRAPELPSAASKDSVKPRIQDGTSALDEWSQAALQFVFRSAVSLETLKNYGVKYSPHQRGLVLPLYGVSNEHLTTQWGYQIRTDSGTPKYITYAPDMWADHVPTPKISRYGKWATVHTIVLCEDVLSAMQVAQVAGVAGVALLGTRAPDVHELLKLVPYSLTKDGEPQRVIVWLDNDNPEVKKAARKTAAKLSEYQTYRVGTVSRGLLQDTRGLLRDRGKFDPKEYTVDTLREILAWDNPCIVYSRKLNGEIS